MVNGKKLLRENEFLKEKTKLKKLVKKLVFYIEKKNTNKKNPNSIDELLIGAMYILRGLIYIYPEILEEY